MGASFRNSGEIKELSGCDLLTIGPQFLKELEEGTLERKLSVETLIREYPEKITVDEKAFRWQLNEDAMASYKLSEGIRKFHSDWLKLTDFAKKI